MVTVVVAGLAHTIANMRSLNTRTRVQVNLGKSTFVTSAAEEDGIIGRGELDGVHCTPVIEPPQRIGALQVAERSADELVGGHQRESHARRRLAHVIGLFGYKFAHAVEYCDHIIVPNAATEIGEAVYGVDNLAVRAGQRGTHEHAGAEREITAKLAFVESGRASRCES